jgi:glycosyltransferase involved in cell wall biosynthesis
VTGAAAGPRCVHQILPSLHVADASGCHALRARQALRRAGWVSELFFVEHLDEDLAGEARPVTELDRHVVAGRTALVYQLAVGSSVVPRLLARREPLVVNYHNLTPASFFWQWAPEWREAVDLGRRQLHHLARRTTHAIAVSAFNARDLDDAGYGSVSVVPPFVDVRAGAPAPRRPPPGRGARWLFVGKLLPHKGAHHLVEALAAYRAAYDPGARLVLVGGAPLPAYAGAVQALVSALGLERAVELAGAVSDAELAARYAEADVFVCVSRHEGFCFPLLEAMAHGLPVVALGAGAVPDTLGPAGLVIDDARPPTVAAAVRRVVADDALRRRLVAAGRRRLACFDPERTAGAFVAELERAFRRHRWPDRP